MRKYIAFYDDGHDFGEFEFWSNHRANSKQNLQDAYNEGTKKFGYSWFKRSTITSVQLRDK